MRFSKQRASLLLDKLLNDCKYMSLPCGNNLATQGRLDPLPPRTVQHENSNYLVHVSQNAKAG